jgi:hypothetical protein
MSNETRSTASEGVALSLRNATDRSRMSHQRAAHRKVFRGSKASRTASPMKISSDSMIAMTKKP